ncbi:LD-carboxypeptidase, partial [Achromobacter xylosoxidans]
MEQAPQGQRPQRNTGRRSFLINTGALCLSAALAGCAAP